MSNSSRLQFGQFSLRAQASRAFGASKCFALQKPCPPANSLCRWKDKIRVPTKACFCGKIGEITSTSFTISAIGTNKQNLPSINFDSFRHTKARNRKRRDGHGWNVGTVFCHRAASGLPGRPAGEAAGPFRPSLAAPKRGDHFFAAPTVAVRLGPAPPGAGPSYIKGAFDHASAHQSPGSAGNSV